eukprot:CAMPEP_0202706116 /NCGR_PEP_ID=MMETSP1385-20130828/18591_1 /ASSEMBLY_ACC=CAM_ASM_000861 /TAXON_ID=933848 /ORGANISM="Elphidium margaritaceum" /LENGTH=127 /DNA_ID=CAMNT_0049364515 /DNA_START=68 /DNA_END=451 /DNA_ORIENTATION=+
MGLKHIWQLVAKRPSREQARFTLRYLRYYDPRTYRALNKFFHTKYGILPEEWADALTEGGKVRRLFFEYRRYFPRHDYGRHFAVMCIIGTPCLHYFIRFFFWYHDDNDFWRWGTDHKLQLKNASYSY